LKNNFLKTNLNPNPTGIADPSTSTVTRCYELVEPGFVDLWLVLVDCGVSDTSLTAFF